MDDVAAHEIGDVAAGLHTILGRGRFGIVPLPSKRPRYAMSFGRSSSNASHTIRSGRSGWGFALAQAMHLSISQAFSLSWLFARSRGVKKRSRTGPTWFTT
jgi:hypothetical protein